MGARSLSFLTSISWVARAGFCALVLSGSAAFAQVDGGPREGANGSVEQLSGQYNIARGDTLTTIAKRFGLSVDQLARENALVNRDRLYEGQRLRLPNSRSITPDLLSSGGSLGSAALPALPQTQPASQHSVQPGETLRLIAQRYGVSMRALADANGLSEPVRIYVSQQLFIPRAAGITAGLPALPSPATPQLAPVPPVQGAVAAAPASGIPPTLRRPTSKPSTPIWFTTSSGAEPAQQLAAVQPKPTPAAPAATATPQVTTAPAPAPTPRPAPAAPSAPAATNNQTAAADDGSLLFDRPPTKEEKFAWPIRGRLLSSFGSQSNGIVNDGINIAVSEGTEIKAADDGTVAYAGEALKNFGKLILVRHADNWVTAYAHNSQLKVAKGDKITRGQVIALSGQSGEVDRPQLHFEVRKDGRALNPLRYLGP